MAHFFLNLPELALVAAVVRVVVRGERRDGSDEAATRLRVPVAAESGHTVLETEGGQAEAVQYRLDEQVT